MCRPDKNQNNKSPIFEQKSLAKIWIKSTKGSPFKFIEQKSRTIIWMKSTPGAHLVDVDGCQWNPFLLELQPDHGGGPGQVADREQERTIILMQSNMKK